MPLSSQILTRFAQQNPKWKKKIQNDAPRFVNCGDLVVDVRVAAEFLFTVCRLGLGAAGFCGAAHEAGVVYDEKGAKLSIGSVIILNTTMRCVKCEVHLVTLTGQMIMTAADLQQLIDGKVKEHEPLCSKKS